MDRKEWKGKRKIEKKFIGKNIQADTTYMHMSIYVFIHPPIHICNIQYQGSSMHTHFSFRQTSSSDFLSNEFISRSNVNTPRVSVSVRMRYGVREKKSSRKIINLHVIAIESAYFYSHQTNKIVEFFKQLSHRIAIVGNKCKQ